MDLNSLLESYIIPILGNPVSKIVLGLFFAYLFVFLSRRIISYFFKRTNLIDERKERSIESLLSSIFKYVATIGFIVYVLTSILDVNVTNILAGAGVLGVILGFGARSLVKDLLAGIFLLFEKRLYQGDWVKVNNMYAGKVEDIGLRFLKLRQWSGTLVTLNNGQVNSIENYNMEIMRVVEDVTVSFYEDPRKLFSLLEKISDRLNEELGCYLKKDESGNPVEAFTMYGISSLNNQFHGYQYRITGICEDQVYFTASKEVRRIIAEMMFDHNIKMAKYYIDMQ
ncbi:mechanosensitive ion channel family protein [Aquibacillus koreensis]|uniref:Mechanosensitive ion channel family protein n=1 Tax=Aquibacillus koreensis TaxID=279446 RepID=A0A9X3WL09_9BACI|nr:mechanosensitive ion channel family protein [Aquibacillus koreensis]MCT2534420.1 mechanosensitive ion channel family protein [Aquibacillus koreensis]MDC3421727.1 mechanosensitive ion channel family protein [Aquibacillus koreensis]